MFIIMSDMVCIRALLPSPPPLPSGERSYTPSPRRGEGRDEGEIANIGAFRRRPSTGSGRMISE